MKISAGLFLVFLMACTHCSHAVQYCSPGWFGEECLSQCSISCEEGLCDSVSGTCDQCPPGRRGDFCQDPDCDYPLDVWFSLDVSVRIDVDAFVEMIAAVEFITAGIISLNRFAYFGAFLVTDDTQHSYGPFGNASDLSEALRDYANNYDNRILPTLTPEESIYTALSYADRQPFLGVIGGLFFLLTEGDQDNPITSETATLSDQISSIANNLKTRGIQVSTIERRPRGLQSPLDFILNQVGSVVNDVQADFQLTKFDQKSVLMDIVDLISIVFDVFCVPVPPATPVITSDNNIPVDGENITLTCTSNSPIIHGYRWKFNDEEVSLHYISQTYTLSPATIPYDNGNYTCTAYYFNIPSDPSDPLTITLKPIKPVLSTDNSDPTDGDLINLFCTTKTLVVDYYKWMLDGEEVSGVTSQTYTMSPADIGTHDGDYTCIAYYDEVASDVSDQLSVVLKPIKPVLSTDNSDPTDGDSINLYCTSDTTEVDGYKWMLDGGVVNGVTSQTYTISPADIGTHDGDYTCIAYYGTVASDTSDELSVVLKPVKPVLSTDNSDPTDGDSINLYCRSDTTEVDGYKWMLDGEEVSGVTSQTYTISPADIGTHDGDYTCIAYYGTLASDTSDQLTLSLKPQPSSLTPSGSQTLENGVDSLSLTCSTASGGSITYIFYKGGSEVQGSASNTRTVNTVAIADSGTYTCVARNYAGDSTSTNSYILRVVDKPAKPDIIADKTLATDGDRITLTCGSSTSEVNVYKWMLDGGVVSGENSRTYTISSAYIDTHDGVYTCIAFIDTVASDSSDELTLSLKPQPSSLTLSGSQTLENGVGSLSLTCKTASGGSITYIFYKGGSEVQGSSPSPSYSVYPVAIADSGTYTCVARNYAGDSTSTNSYILRVVDKPAKPDINADKTLTTDGDSITLTCTSSTSEVNVYKWNLDGNEVKTTTSPTYTILSAYIDANDGVYTCTALIDTVTSDTSDQLTVSLKPQPSSLDPNGKKTLGNGVDILSLSCKTASGGSISYIFYKGGSEVRGPSSDRFYSVYTVAKTDAGTYTCVARNYAGDSTSTNSYIVKVVDKPAKPNISIDNNYATDGDRITLTCTSSTPEVNFYEWMLNDGVLGGVTSQNYTISPAYIGSDNGIYTCIALIDTIASDTSDRESVFIIPLAPSMTPTGSHTIEDGIWLTKLTCKSPSSGSFKYKFYRDDEYLGLEDDTIYKTEILTRSQSGKYTCVASNDAGDSDVSTDFFQLTVT